jgi:hypothetical protein
MSSLMLLQEVVNSSSKLYTNLLNCALATIVASRIEIRSFNRKLAHHFQQLGCSHFILIMISTLEIKLQLSPKYCLLYAL